MPVVILLVITQLLIVGDASQQFIPVSPLVMVKPASTQLASSPPENVTTSPLPPPSITVAATTAGSFGSVDLRRAFNQVRILDAYDYGQDGAFVGLDVKAMRTQKQDACTKHLSNSRTIFMQLLDLVRTLDKAKIDALIGERDYEELDLLIINHLMGK